MTQWHNHPVTSNAITLFQCTKFHDLLSRSRERIYLFNAKVAWRWRHWSGYLKKILLTLEHSIRTTSLGKALRHNANYSMLAFLLDPLVAYCASNLTRIGTVNSRHLVLQEDYSLISSVCKLFILSWLSYSAKLRTSSISYISLS